jgi:hypothetical protein
LFAFLLFQENFEPDVNTVTTDFGSWVGRGEYSADVLGGINCRLGKKLGFWSQSLVARLISRFILIKLPLACEVVKSWVFRMPIAFSSQVLSPSVAGGTTGYYWAQCIERIEEVWSR